MASFSVDFKPSVHKDFRRLPKSVVERVMKRIEKLKDEPFPHGVDKLEGVERLYRIVVGDYRIVYEPKSCRCNSLSPYPTWKTTRIIWRVGKFNNPLWR